MAEAHIMESSRRAVPAALPVLLMMLAALAPLLLGPLSATVAAVVFGAGALALLQVRAMGRWPRLVEAATDVAVLAVLAAVRGDAYRVWQVPDQWSDLLRLSTAGSSLAIAIYLGVGATMLLRSRRHARARQVCCILLLPILFNLLLLLGNEVLMRRLGFWLTFEAAVDDGIRALLGRGLVLIVFAEALTIALRALVTGSMPREPRLHLLLVGSAMHAALSAPLADFPDQAAAGGPVLQDLVGIVCAALAQAGLWALVFVITGIAIDALRVRPPTLASVLGHWRNGLTKGAIYGGVFMALLIAAGALLKAPGVTSFAAEWPVLAGALGGALVFPLAATVVASADETPPFFGRLRAAYREPRAYWRGAVAGLGTALALSAGLPERDGAFRFVVTFVIGALAYGGVDLAYDAVAKLRRERPVLEGWRIYGLGLLLGGLVGGALGWYFETSQIAVVVAKFWSYVALSGHPAGSYVIYPLFSKWGTIDLGHAGGGVRQFFDESLSGVIEWGIAAPLFSINYFVLAAVIDRSLTPLKQLFSPKGFEGLVEQTVRVLRWGLWMSPVINSFLRQSPDPSWYNQDGAVRTVAATVAQAYLPPQTFRSWSLSVFTGLLAYDWLRVLIWFDHMGLRVATLVNLTFLGGDRADEAAARFAGYGARTRIMPVGIRRFATWAPLLIPFYIPRGVAWDTAWKGAEQIRTHVPPISLPVNSLMLAYAVAGAGALAVAGAVVARWDRRKPPAEMETVAAPSVLDRAPARFALANGQMRVQFLPDGRGHSSINGTTRGGHGVDIDRAVADPMQISGPFFFLRDRDSQGLWSLGYEPLRSVGPDYRTHQAAPNIVVVQNTVAGIRAEAELRLDEAAPLEIWRIRLTNTEDRSRRLALSSYREIVVHEAGAYVRDPDFNAMHVQTWFVARLNGLFLRNRLLRGSGSDRMSPEIFFHAVQTPEGTRLTGYEDSRTRFLGTAGIRDPEGLSPGAARKPEDEGSLYTFDPAASLTVEIELPPGAGRELVFLTGWARDEYQAADIVAGHLGAVAPAMDEIDALWDRTRDIDPRSPYPAAAWPFSFENNGTELHLTAATPRPWAHILANAAGFGTMVSNTGEIHSFNANARQNALTPFRFESVPAANPGQLVYVVDLGTGEVDTPGFVPSRRVDARHEVVYSRGSAQFTKVRGDTALDLTVFLPPDSPADIRLLTIHNRSQHHRRFRVLPYFEMALDENTETSLGRLVVQRDETGEVLLFNNPANDFHKGWAFVTTSLTAPVTETVRTRFVGGSGRDLTNPFMVEKGVPDSAREDDGHRVAVLAGTVDVPPGTQAEIVIVLGQADSRSEAVATALALRDPASARAALKATRAWWDERLNGVQVETNDPAFDRLVNHWLPYQVLAARLWGRNGPNQRGGAFGFRDQLQDVLPLIVLDPNLARRQIVFHSAAQFPEGDVFKWWHMAPNGRMGLGQRTRASDPHLWLPYTVIRYLDGTGDRSILDDQVAYLDGPAIPPGVADLVIAPRPSPETGSVYDHCRRAIDYSLARMGSHGLPLVGTGDWNDGIDAAGREGRGESLWLAFFLHDVLRRFIPIAASREGEAAAAVLTGRAEQLKDAIASAWAGDHFIFDFMDDGERLDPVSIMTAAWPALSGAVDHDRARAALEHGLRSLEKPDRVLLLQPAFDEFSFPYPGRIADYPPGVRENGGQYSHGASWTVDAYLWLAETSEQEGDPALAAELRTRAQRIWFAISPLGKTEGDALAVYGLAPHQQPADIYDGPGYAGRGGWSWYTGAAARMLSTAYALMGLRMEQGQITLSHHAFEPRGPLQLKRMMVRGREYHAPDGTAQDPARDPMSTAAQ